MAELSERVSGLLAGGKTGWEIHFEAISRKRAGEDLLVLTAGDHDFPTPVTSVDAVIEAVRSGHHHYNNLDGAPALKAAMAKVSSRVSGVEATPANIIATTGGQGALYAAMQAVCDPGDHVILISPYYATYPGTVKAANATFTAVAASAEAGFQPDAADIEAAIGPRTRAILINSPNNPTGAVYSPNTLEAIADVCRRHDLWLISDEVYWTLTGGTAHVSPLALEGMAARTLVVNSMSKSHGMTGWRVGWLTGPAHVMAALVGLNLVTTYGLNDFVSVACAQALEEGWGTAEISSVYDSRRTAFLAALGNAPGFTVRGSRGGIYAMLDIRETTGDGDAFARSLLDAERVAVMPGESFGEAAAGHVRISLCADEKTLAEAAARIKRHISRKMDEDRTND